VAAWATRPQRASDEPTDSSETILLARKMTPAFVNFFVKPVAIGDGLRVFSSRKPLTLAGSTAYSCGVVVNTYRQP
jgi:hypothetical protein